MKTIPRASLLIATVAAVACKPSQPSADYLAVCEGQPLRTVERRNQAMEDGYEIDRRYDCITKHSANTPEAEFERRVSESKIRLEAQAKAEVVARAERVRQWAAAEATPIENVEINSATELQLADLQVLSADVVHQIVEERTRARFKGWDDVVRRVVGLSAAETAVRASAFGLTVNGLSLEGAESDSAIARYARAKWRRRNE